MPQSNYSRFSDGVQISGISMNVHQKGRVFYVCNSSVPSQFGVVSGSGGADGKTPDRPLATIAAAVALCVASRGDKIILLPGHAETISAAAGINCNVAGVSIIADPSAVGSQRPTITLGTANTATFKITANEVVVSGVLFVANFLNIATCIDITTATDVVISGCEFRDTSSVLNFVKAIRTDSTANHADGLQVIGNRYLGLGTSATTSLVQAQAAINRMVVNANSVDIQGTTATTGALVLATGNALTGARILGNDVASNLSTATTGTMIIAGSGGSGFVADNYVLSNAGAGVAIIASTGTGLAFHNNLQTDVADASGFLLPAADS